MIYKIQGMMCMHCAAAVEKAIKGIPGVTAVTVSLDDKTADVCGGDRDAIIKAVEAEGFKVL